MSKATKKPVKGNKKVTDYFGRTTAPTSSPLSSSEPLRRSQPNAMAISSPRTQSSKARGSAATQGQKSSSTAKDKRLLLADADAISISSGSAGHISISSRSHITISSDSSAPVVAASSSKPLRRSKRLSTSSNDEAAPAKKPSKLRTASSSSAKTTVKRVLPSSSSKSLKRKFGSDSDSDIPDIVPVPYPGRSRPIEDSPPLEPHHSSSPGPPSSVPPVTPQNQLAPLPLDDAGSPRSSKASKRPRLTPPPIPLEPTAVVSTAVSGNEADVEDVIPSSQSDEHELTIPKQIVIKSPAKTREEVDRWRQETVPVETSLEEAPTDDCGFPEVPMDVDFDPIAVSESVTLDGSSSDVSTAPSSESRRVSGSSDTQTSEAEVNEHLEETKSVQVPSSPLEALTPLPDEFDNISMQDVISRSGTPPPLPQLAAVPSPVAITAQEKTKRMIEQIRAEHLARRPSSSPPPVNLEDLESDDDSELDDNDPFQLRKPTEPKAAQTSSQVTVNEPRLSMEPEAESGRYSFRKRSPGAGPSTAPGKLPRLVSVAEDSRRASSSRKFNPLDALLKKKTLADKRGGGSEAFAAAEATAAAIRRQEKSKAKSNPLESDDEEFADEDAAERVMKRLQRSTGRFSSDDESDMDLDADDFEKYLGDKGKAVQKIVAGDRQTTAAEAKKPKTVRGVSLWAPTPLQLSIRKKTSNRKTALPEFPLKGSMLKNPILTALSAAANSSDIARVALLLRPECLPMIPAPCRAPLFSWLLDVALISSDSYITSAISRTLECFTERLSGIVVVSYSQLVSTMIRLGAQPTTLQVDDTPDHLQPSVDIERRDLLLSHLASLLVTLSKHRCLSGAELPDIILLLLLVALDVTNSLEAQDDIVTAINSILASIQLTGDIGVSLESQIANRVLEYALGLHPINQAYLLSLFNRSCPQSSRIARWVARGCLLRLSHSSPGAYTGLPDISPFISLLSPSPNSREPFDIFGNANEDGFFEDLGYRMDILSFALSDIDGYVQEERLAAASQPAPPPSPRTGGTEKPQSPLETVKTLLDTLHGRITDTRAAHLDRSRTKAAVQQLSLRVHYQRQTSLRYASSTTSAKPRNLKGYFGPTPKHRPAS
ncbi:hypothetical protein EIP91_006132 [Steccherinum ochraceum]|uniref:Uncharacterized protein n=1 Tax=Steccherinum ochraceum TaxID=92696 RepID=A0A4R0RVG0_9APHY|nr:hypothetical protein EIP91_006132 [Steccherinum ochraceum]